MLRAQKVQYISDPDKPVLTSTLQKDLVKEWINKMVTKAKESPIAQWASPVLLTIILGYVVYNGQATNADIREITRDVTVLRTQKAEADKELEREKQEKFQILREQEAYREKFARELLELKLVTQGKVPKSLIGTQ